MSDERPECTWPRCHRAPNPCFSWCKCVCHARKAAPTDAEWRERIGVAIMHAMVCAHDGAAFGDKAVCVTCFENTQHIGRLMEREIRRAIAEAEERGAARVRERIRKVHGRYFDLDAAPISAGPEPEDVWRYDRDLRAALGGDA